VVSSRCFGFDQPSRAGDRSCLPDYDVGGQILGVTAVVGVGVARRLAVLS